MQQSQSKIEFANTLRGVAAILVLISHYMGVFWTHREAVAHYTQIPQLDERFVTPSYVHWLHFHPWINWGALGVGLFFLISGFVIPFSLQGRRRRDFAIARAWRLIPTYAAGFSVTLIALYFGTHGLGIPWPYSALEVIVHYAPGVRDIFRTPNIDGIVWTLEVEVKFYVMVMLLMPLFAKRHRSILLVPVAIVIFHEIYFDISDLLYTRIWILDIVARPFALAAPFLILMWMGVTLHLKYNGVIGLKMAAASLALQYGLFIYLWSSFSSDESIGAFVSYSAAIPLFLLAMHSRDKFRPNAITGFFADISYPLYVVHAVAGYILMQSLLLSGLSSGIAIASATIAATAIAAVIHRLIEKPTHKIGRTMRLSRPVARVPENRPPSTSGAPLNHG